VAAWMLQALAGLHDITVCSWRPVELQSINAYYGTRLRLGDATWASVPAVLRLLDSVPVPFTLLKSSLLFRRVRKLVANYDVVICGHNETDFGATTLQYIHYPAHLRPRPAADLRWYHGWSRGLAVYYALCDLAADFRPERVVEATTLTNSTWIAERVVELYGETVRPRVVPPPVEMEPSPLDWGRRLDGFVCIGRIAPEKELERVIRILAQVRETCPEVRLHLIGSRGPSRYVRRVERIARQAGSWVELHFDVARPELIRLIHQNRYAIHGMSEEHFGIAPAEALLGGCVVFVPDGGGQVDIVGPDRRLRFTTDQEAVTRIVSVLQDEQQQAMLRSYLSSRRELFTRARFEQVIRDLVHEIHDRHG
jgi:glycosyltransferase involved in cell wall biosynthesis